MSERRRKGRERESPAPGGTPGAEAQPAAGFEQRIRELEEAVAALEREDLDLEEALRQYARGLQALQAGQELLAQAERKVEVLTRDAQGRLKLAPFAPEDPENKERE